MDVQDKKMYLKRSLDTNNAFLSTSAEGIKVNPKIWDRRLRDYQRELLVVTPLAESFDFRMPGRDLTVTIDEKPDAAVDLTETADIDIVPFKTRQVTFVPDERGSAYQLTRKEAVRAFFDVAERMVNKLAHATALRKDNLAVAELYENASLTIRPNDKAEGALAAGDTMDLTSILKARAHMHRKLYRPAYLLVAWGQEKSILALSNVYKANEFGTRDGISRGVIGNLFGIQVIASDSIPEDSSGEVATAKAIMLGNTRTGERALGYAIKRDLLIETEYHARGRRWDIVAHEEYDFKVLHEDAVILIETAVSVVDES